MTGLRWLIGALAAAVFASAVALVYVQHAGRQAFERHQKLVAERDRLDVEWGQLQLELGTLATHGRIERVARERLNMTMPDPDEIVIVEHD